MITPAKKPAHGELTDSDKRNNTTINRVRYLIERVIANVKTWRVLHTDYRRPYNGGVKWGKQRVVSGKLLVG